MSFKAITPAFKARTSKPWPKRQPNAGTLNVCHLSLLGEVYINKKAQQKTNISFHNTCHNKKPISWFLAPLGLCPCLAAYQGLHLDGRLAYRVEVHQVAGHRGDLVTGRDVGPLAIQKANVAQPKVAICLFGSWILGCWCLMFWLLIRAFWKLGSPPCQAWPSPTSVVSCIGKTLQSTHAKIDMVLMSFSRFVLCHIPLAPLLARTPYKHLVQMEFWHIFCAFPTCLFISGPSSGRPKALVATPTWPPALSLSAFSALDARSEGRFSNSTWRWGGLPVWTTALCKIYDDIW